MDTYVVCMDSVWIRNAEMFDTVGLDVSGIGFDMLGEEHESRWHEMEPTPFIAVVKAENEKEACKKAAVEMRYDPRCLFAIKVSE